MLAAQRLPRLRAVDSIPRQQAAINQAGAVTARQRLGAALELLTPIKEKSVAVLLEQLGLMIVNGLSPGAALHSLAQQQDDPRLGGVVETITGRVHSGCSLSSSFARHPKLFPPATLAVIRAGEEGGDIGGRLQRAGRLLMRQADLQAKLKHAVSGPLITAGICGFVLLLVVKVVFPRFIALYQQMDMVLPTISRVVFLLVGLFDHPLTMLLLVSLGLATVLYRDELKQRLLSFLLCCPWTQGMVGKVLCASFCETLSYLYRDGVPVHRAMRLLSETSPIELHQRKLEQAQKTLTQTGSLSEALQSVDYFPPVFHSMLAVGEESATMEQMLNANQRLMDEEIDSVINSVAAALEPLMISLMGVSMAFLFVGMFLPIYGLLEKLGG